MLDRIAAFAGEYGMFAPGDTAVCGLSGGADSVCLLLSLCELRERFGISVEALHVNHHIRGAESDRDEEFCRELCREKWIAFTAVSCDVPAFAREKSLSDEEAARTLRYKIFDEYSRGRKMCTAHNAGDNLETVILNLTRGTALKGLAGIPPVRGNIVRPLLTVTRREIEDFLDERGQAFITDSTNLSEDYTRNKIRRRIIPLLEEINSSVIETSVRTIDGLRMENDYIEEQVSIAFERCFRDQKLCGASVLPELIRRRCIARLLSEAQLPYSHRRLEECSRIAVSGGKTNISGDVYFVSDGRAAGLERISARKAPAETEQELIIGENRIFPGRTLKCELILCDKQLKNAAVNKNLTFYLIDYDKIIGRAVVRNRRFGDRIQLAGRDFSSSVKKLINETVPSQLRQVLHFIEDEEGTVFAEHIGIAARVSPDGNTKRLLKITVCDF